MLDPCEKRVFILPMSTPNFPQIEKEMLETWSREGTFARSLKQREGSKRFSFYDGPPFANGLPHPGHVVPVTLKDAITRYKTMRGYYVPRRNGWDTHGLPVENEVEKQLGLKDKQEILQLGVEKFNQACRDSVFKYKQEWEDFFDRMGRWAEKDNSYATLDDTYIESVWWVLSQLHKKQLLYQGFRSMAYCPRCATPLSNFEVNQNYKDDVPDPSVYVLFRLEEDDNTALLAWTTTPWTLPANAALAVDSTADYVKLQMDQYSLIVAAKRVEALDLQDKKVIQKLKGDQLVGLAYRPLYELASATPEERQKAFKVFHADDVSLEEGTGVLHVAPRYGETDLSLGEREGLPLFSSVDEFGYMTDNMGPFRGMFFKDADGPIIADLTHKGSIFAAEEFTHTYPFCWRCETPLMYFATPSWFIKVSGLAKAMVATNQQIKWVPGNIRDGRFGNWLAEARDWGISRNRFWGAPLPIWKCSNEHFTVISSLEELREKAVDPGMIMDLHRPGIDAVKLSCEECMQEASRVEEVFDCWFESGSMPYAQDHYPFENEAAFKEAFPADFIAEAIDQTRGWFYTLHVLATALYDKPAFKNVIVNGHILAADGKKLSKRLRNYPELDDVFDKYGADTLRFFMMTSPVVSGESVRFSAQALAEVQRNVFMTLWNVSSFFSTYSKIDKWQPGPTLEEPISEHVLDRWLLSRLNQTIAETTKATDKYEVARAVRPLRELIEDLSNWYVRRSRRRFWKSEDDTDKQSAYATLHYALLRISQLLAPWAPFLADKLWRELTAGMKVADSVHLSDWPTDGEVDKALLIEMHYIRSAITEGLSIRAAAKIKVRQPLSKATIHNTFDIRRDDLSALRSLVAEELNVKEVVIKRVGDAESSSAGVDVELETELTPELEREGLARDIVRQVQSCRKHAGLEVDDRIRLSLSSPVAQLSDAIEEHSEMITQETLAAELLNAPTGSDFETVVEISGCALSVGISKTKA